MRGTFSRGDDFGGVLSSGSKPERARPLAAAIANGLVSLRSEASLGARPNKRDEEFSIGHT